MNSNHPKDDFYFFSVTDIFYYILVPVGVTIIYLLWTYCRYHNIVWYAGKRTIDIRSFFKSSVSETYTGYGGNFGVVKNVSIYFVKPYGHRTNHLTQNAIVTAMHAKGGSRRTVTIG